MTRRYLSRKQVAEMIGVQPDSLGKYKLPAPDVYIGDIKGWRPETIQRWHQSRPGKGNYLTGANRRPIVALTDRTGKILGP